MNIAPDGTSMQSTNECYYTLHGYPINTCTGFIQIYSARYSKGLLACNSNNCNSGNLQPRLRIFAQASDWDCPDPPLHLLLLLAILRNPTVRIDFCCSAILMANFSRSMCLLIPKITQQYSLKNDVRCLSTT